MPGKRETMHTKTEIMERLDELNRASPPEYEGKTEALFEPVRAAVETYFTSDGVFAHDAQYTIHQLAGDIMTRATKYEHQEKMPTPPTNFPTGYENIADLFDGGSAFPEITTIDVETFVEAYYEEQPEEGGDEGGEGGEPILHNPYLEKWADQIAGAREGELAGLDAICQFCDSGGYNAGLAMLFEELGEVVESLSVNGLAQRIYTDGEWLALITEFSLRGDVPAIIREEATP